MQVSIEYLTRRDPDSEGWFVMEKLLGAEGGTEFGPMPGRVVESFIRARREHFDRELRLRGATKLITPQPKVLRWPT